MYLIVNYDSSVPFESNTYSVKDAIINYAKYTGDSWDLFLKCIKNFDENDIKGLVELFNHFSSCDAIRNIYEVKKKVI